MPLAFRSSRNSSDLGEKVEKRIDTLPQLRLDLLPRTLQDVHRHACLVAILQRHRGVTYAGDLVCRQQPHAIHQGQVCHTVMVKPRLHPPSGLRIPCMPFPHKTAGEAKVRWTYPMAENDVRNVVILGSGCAGLTAAIYTGRSNLKPLVVEGHEPGGQLSITTLVENFPGWPEGIQGPELVENMKIQAARFGAEYRTGHLVSADLSARPFVLNFGKDQVLTHTLVIASGASARWLNLPSEQELIGHGVSSCATCDGFFFGGKEIAVVGGGDSAMEEALFLTRFASKVTLLHRSDTFRASAIMLERARAHEKIEFRTNVAVEEVLGVEEREVRGVRLRDRRTDELTDLPISGLFLGIGHEPNAKAFAGQIELDEDGYIKTHENVFTRVAGVFACGDVQDRRYRQAITAAGSGCMAALEVEKYLEEHGK